MSSYRLVRALSAVAVVAAAGGGVWYWSSARLTAQDRFRQAWVALDRGDTDAAAEAAVALDSDPRYAQHVCLLDAGVLLRSGQPQQALALLSPLNPAPELRRPWLLCMAECLYVLGRLSEAEVMLRQVVREHPDDVAAHRWLGAVYYDLGAYTAAITALTRVAELDPGDCRPHRLIGLMYYDFEQNSRAIEHYRRALALDPPAEVATAIRRELAQSLAAERLYAEALELIPPTTTDAAALAVRAESLWSLGRKAEARQCIERARAINPRERGVVLVSSRMLMDDAEAQLAIDLLDEFLKHRPNDAECRYQLALAHRQQGNTEHYEIEMARWQELSSLHSRLTELNVKALDNPRDAETRDQLARICDVLGKSELAAMWRQAAAACRQTPDISPSEAP